MRDSQNCTLPIEVTIVPTEIPSVEFSDIDYDCSGYGTFTVTASATASLTYQYQVDNGELLTSNVIGPLAPRTTPYTITVYYTPEAGTGTTPNYLYTEDFGTGEDICMSNINYLSCKTDEALEDGFYAVTQQIEANSDWVSPAPTDASGVFEGRYLAVMQGSTTGNLGVIYYKEIKDIVAGENVNVSLNVFNLLSASSSGQNPHLVIDFINSAGTVLETRDLGTVLKTASWQAKEAVFTGLSVDTAIFRIRNISTGTTLGNDLAIDDIVIWQDTKYCESSVSNSILIEEGKNFATQLLSVSNATCPNSETGTATVKVNNPPSMGVIEYSTDNQASWATATLSSNGNFTVVNLAPTTSGILYVRDPAISVVWFRYVILLKNPIP